MSQRLAFFRAVSILYQNQCLDALDYCLAETDHLIAQIEYQKQVDAPFWHLLLRADGTVVQICRNFAGYFGETPQSLGGRSFWQFLMPDHPGQAQALARQVLETGLAVSGVFLPGTVASSGWCAARCPGCSSKWATWWPCSGCLRTSVLRRRSPPAPLIDCGPSCSWTSGGMSWPWIRWWPAGWVGRPGCWPGAICSSLFPPDKARRRWASFQETAWTGQPMEYLEEGETGVRYDMYKVPVFGHDGHVARVLVLAREQHRAFQAVEASSAVHRVE